MNITKVKSSSEISVMKLHKSDIENLSSMMHDKFNRCGGFIVHDSEAEAMETLFNNNNRSAAKFFAFSDYTITEEARVENMDELMNDIVDLDNEVN